MYPTITELKAAISAETARANSSFTDQFDGFILRAEKRIFFGAEGAEPLRCREMEARATLIFQAGVGATPEGFLGARRLTWEGSRPYQLKYREPEDFYGGDYWGSGPQIFTIDGERIDIRPAESGTATLSYYKLPQTIIGSIPVYDENGEQVRDESGAVVTMAGNTTNRILRDHGDIYLYAALVEAYIFLRNDEKIAESNARLRGAIAGLNLTAVKARYAGTHLAPRIPGAYGYGR